MITFMSHIRFSFVLVFIIMPLQFNFSLTTRKPCYRKDDRAMRPIYECPETFRVSTATRPEIFNGLLLRSIVLKCVQNLKFVALSVPEIIERKCPQIKNLGSPWLCPRSFFSNILMGFYSDGRCECIGQI